jgi:hypothetical protein
VLLISITISGLAVLGWINAHDTSAGSPEHIQSSLFSNLTGASPATVNNTAVIAENNSGNTYLSKNVLVTAMRSGNTIEIRNYGERMTVS